MDSLKKQPDLGYWDFADRFSGHDAAALILGIEPRESEHEQARIRVVTDRMAQHYEYACTRVFSEPKPWEQEPINTFPVRQRGLHSIQLNSLQWEYWTTGIQETFLEWLTSGRQAKFENQEFSRHEIDNWLTSIGMRSVYMFRPDPSGARHISAGRWPWGAYHTEMLGHLEAAALRFWTGYEPSDATTANTNATVSDWLQTERKVSRTMADAIASMLRPDGLPTGPRKS